MLTTLLLIPLIGALLVALTRKECVREMRIFAIAASFLTLVMTCALLGFFDRGRADFQFEERVPWVESIGISYHVGVDGISIVLVLLSAIVGFSAVLVSTDVQSRQKEFYVLLLLMLDGVLGAFISLDLFFLYFFHELALIPTFLMVGIWGNSIKADKSFAAMKLTIYLSVGAFLALIGLLALYIKAGATSFDLTDLASVKLAAPTQANIFGLLLIGFGILVALCPFHTWSPVGYGAAPTATAMMHAGVLKKFGLYALLRIALPLLPQGINQPLHFKLWIIGPVYFTWSEILVAFLLCNILYIGLVTLAQRDFNYVIGYSSVMHMGYAFLGIASLTTLGLTGAVLLMFAHGITAALAFALVGYVTAQTGIRDLDELGGLAKKMPFVATAFTMAAFAACGLPGFANFVAELLIFFGSWQKYPWAVVAAAWGVVISAVYMLRATRDAFFGPFNPRWSRLADAKDAGEKFPFVLLIAVSLVVGFWPRSLTDVITPSVEPIAAKYSPRASAPKPVKNMVETDQAK